jgi:uncharacterized protein (DUF2252 family)
VAPDPAARREAGRDRRGAVARSAHGDWTPSPTRRDPLDVLEDQAATREPDLVPIRYGRMAASPFAFFRGAAAVMAMDLAETPVTGMQVQACGDAHVNNFGQFATPERNLIFDINDFDETLPGPWEWDIKRLCASLAVVARGHGFPAATCDQVVMAASGTYRDCLADSARMRALDIWYDRIHIDQVVSHFPRRYRPLVERDVAKSRRKTHLRAVAKLTSSAGGQVAFVEDPPLLVHLDNTGFDMDDVRPMIEGYRASLSDDLRPLFDRYRLMDVARKVVGVGSVGTRCWIALFEGPARRGGDHLILQIKEAPPSVLQPYVDGPAPDHQGHRVVTGQRLTQAASDIFLGWTQGPRSGRQYYVRQLWDFKGQGDPLRMDLGNLTHYGALCAWALARAHARTGEPAELAGYLGSGAVFDRAMASFSAAYATVNDRDHARLVEAIAEGRIPAQVV